MQQHAKPMQLRADSYLSAFSFLSTYVEYESWRCTAISELMINEQIRDKEVRLIGENGEHTQQFFILGDIGTHIAQADKCRRINAGEGDTEFSFFFGCQHGGRQSFHKLVEFATGLV